VTLPVSEFRELLSSYHAGSPSLPAVTVLGEDILTEPGKLDELIKHIPTDLLDDHHGRGGNMGLPVRMEVFDESNIRGKVPARVCLLGQHRNVWLTLALPKQEQ